MRKTGHLAGMIKRRPPPYLCEGLRRVPYSTGVFDIRAAAAQHVLSGKFANEPLPLETLHHRVHIEDQVPVDNLPVSRVSAYASEIGPEFIAAYRSLVRYLARDVLGFDVLFEANPALRFHFPVPMPDRFRCRDGTMLTHHSDTLLGDSFHEINCWLPLTRCYGTAALLAANLPDSIEALWSFAKDIDFDESAYQTGRLRFFQKLFEDEAFRTSVVGACAPVETTYGEVIMFDPRTIHGTAENVEDLTRASIDFRLLPLAEYQAWERALAASGEAVPSIPDELVEFTGVPATHADGSPRSSTQLMGTSMVRGAYFDSTTAFEL